MPGHPHAAARIAVGDDRALVARPDDVRDGRVGVGRTVDAAGQRAGEVDVTGLREHVRQVCSERGRRQHHRHTDTPPGQRHRHRHHHHHHLTATDVKLFYTTRTLYNFQR